MKLYRIHNHVVDETGQTHDYIEYINPDYIVCIHGTNDDKLSTISCEIEMTNGTTKRLTYTTAKEAAYLINLFEDSIKKDKKKKNKKKSKKKKSK